MIRHHYSKVRTMDRFDAMRAFTRIVERRSFTQAAEDLGLPRSSVTDAVKALEARLGVRLLQRTTRQVSPTLDGEAYYQRCVSLIADMEEAEGAFAGAKPSGLIRIDVHGTQAGISCCRPCPASCRGTPASACILAKRTSRWT
jgi:DNA-binding transcriptional LysR family regulator